MYIDGVLLWPANNTAGLDLAETYPTNPDDALMPGELVAMGETATNNVGTIRRTNGKEDTKLFGVIATQPGYTLDDNGNYPKATVALKGRVPVKVTTENGNITVGDGLTSSSIPGVAMKATRPTKIIGYAMTGYAQEDKTKVGEVVVFVNPEYFNPGTLVYNGFDDSQKNQILSYFESIPEITFNTISSSISQTQKLIAQVINAGNATIDSIIAKNIQTDTLHAQKVTTDTLETQNASVSGTLAAKNISSEGTISAKRVEGENITEQQENLTSLRERLKKVALEGEVKNENLSTQVNDIQQTLADMESEKLPDPQYYQNLDGTNLSSLTVSNDANIYDLFVTHVASLGNLMIQDNTISSSMAELKLTALESINLLDGAVVIAKDGTITTKGALIALGGVQTNNIKSTNKSDIVVTLEKNNNPTKTNEFQIKNNDGQVVSSITEEGKAKFKELQLDSIDTATASGTIIAASQNIKINGVNAPAVITNAAASGTAVMPSGAIDLVVYNDTIGANSLIYITPTTPTQNNNLYVAYKEPCSQTQTQTTSCKPFFKVSIDNKINTDVKFNWLLINNH